VVAEPGATREPVLEAAGSEPFEKDGFVWVGHLGLRFDDDGRPLEAVPSVEPL
jgi:hypothetical protein